MKSYARIAVCITLTLTPWQAIARKFKWHNAPAGGLLTPWFTASAPQRFNCPALDLSPPPLHTHDSGARSGAIAAVRAGLMLRWHLARMTSHCATTHADDSGTPSNRLDGCPVWSGLRWATLAARRPVPPTPLCVLATVSCAAGVRCAAAPPRPATPAMPNALPPLRHPARQPRAAAAAACICMAAPLYARAHTGPTLVPGQLVRVS